MIGQWHQLSRILYIKIRCMYSLSRIWDLLFHLMNMWRQAKLQLLECRMCMKISPMDRRTANKTLHQLPFSTNIVDKNSNFINGGEGGEGEGEGGHTRDAMHEHLWMRNQ